MGALEQLQYELRPIIYFVIGFWTAHLDHPIKWISVTIFIVVSILIIIWRRKARGY